MLIGWVLVWVIFWHCLHHYYFLWKQERFNPNESSQSHVASEPERRRVPGFDWGAYGPGEKHREAAPRERLEWNCEGQQRTQHLGHHHICGHAARLQGHLVQVPHRRQLPHLRARRATLQVFRSAEKEEQTEDNEEKDEEFELDESDLQYLLKCVRSMAYFKSGAYRIMSKQDLFPSMYTPYILCGWRTQTWAIYSRGVNRAGLGPGRFFKLRAGPARRAGPNLAGQGWTIL